MTTKSKKSENNKAVSKKIINIYAFQVCLQTFTPVLWWGLPGVGKSDVTEQTAKALGWAFEPLMASTLDPTDIGGVPMIVNGVPQRVCMLEEILNLVSICKDGKKNGILFLDELTTLPPAIQAPALRLIQKGIAGTTHLPPNVARAAAANPPELAANGYSLAPPMANRFCHLQWVDDNEQWISAFLLDFCGSLPVLRVPSNWMEFKKEIKPKMAAFVKMNPTLFSPTAFPKSETEQGKAWSSRRTSTMMADLLAAVESVNLDDASREFLTLELASGCIGESGALTYLAFCKDLDLPDVEEVLAFPEKFKFPKRVDRQLAVLVAIVQAVVGHPTEERWLAAWRIMDMAAGAGAIDIAAVTVNPLVRLHGQHPEFPLGPIGDCFIPFMEILGRIPKWDL